MSATDGTILTSIKSPGPNPQGLTYDGEHLWVSDRTDRKIFKVVPATGQVIFSIAFDGELAGTAWDGSHVWQADRTSRTISRIDPETGTIALSLGIDLPSGDVTGLHYETGGVWYGLSRLGQARKVRESDGRFMRALPTKGDICGLVLVGRHLYYTEPSEGLCHKMDATAGAILISYRLGGRPTGLCYDGTAFWVSDAEAGELRRLRF
jgi:glutamine cyclotransferase